MSEGHDSEARLQLPACAGLKNSAPLHRPDGTHHHRHYPTIASTATIRSTAVQAKLNESDRIGLMRLCM